MWINGLEVSEVARVRIHVWGPSSSLRWWHGGKRVKSTNCSQFANSSSNSTPYSISFQNVRENRTQQFVGTSIIYTYMYYKCVRSIFVAGLSRFRPIDRRRTDSKRSVFIIMCAHRCYAWEYFQYVSHKNRERYSIRIVCVVFTCIYVYMIYMYVKMLSNRNTHSHKQTSPSIQPHTSIDRLRPYRNKQRLWWVTNTTQIHTLMNRQKEKENRSEQPRWVPVSKWQDIIFPCICTIFIYLSLAWPHGSQHHTTQSHGNYTRHGERASGRTSATV